MIELSPKEYWKTLNYHDALLYCQLLTIDGKNDWRMTREVSEYHPEVSPVELIWCEKDVDEFPLLLDNEYICIPVRDLED